MSIWLLKNPAADCTTFNSVSPIFVFASFDNKITLPITSPCEIIGYTTWELYFLSLLSFFVTGIDTSLFSLLVYTSLYSNTCSNSLLKSCSKNSFLEPPETAITVSLSVIHAICPVVFAKVSAYPVANSESSPIGEYFLRMTSPSLSVNISNGSPSFILNVFLISFGITILPKSSIRLTTPVAFEIFPPSCF